MHIKESRKLQNEDILDETWREMLYIFEATTLEDEDYVILSFEGTDIQMIHGFPGDNPFGILVRGCELVLEFGEPFAIMGEYAFEGNDAVGEFHSDKEDTMSQIMEWYMAVTGNMCNYGHDFWYSKGLAVEGEN